MGKGISVHVGVDEAELPGITVPTLRGCANDAIKMSEIANANGFLTEVLVNGGAKREAVVGAIEKANAELVDGDIFLFTFSGHGTRHGTNDRTEVDLKDESIVLFDKILTDNVFRRALWPMFKTGVRILTISDCCHGGGAFLLNPNVEGTNSGSQQSAALPNLGGANYQESVNDEPKLRELEEGLNEVHFVELGPFYDVVRAELANDPPPINADLLLLSACQEQEKAKDGDPNGVFTWALLKVMAGNNNPSDYQKFHTAIKEKLAGESQHPVLTLFEGSNPAFMNERPFSI